MLIKPKKPKPPNKKKLGEWKKVYNKKKVKPKKLPQGPKKGTGDEIYRGKPSAPKSKNTKGKTPNWRDSAYLKQESYLKKLLADFQAKQIRSKADLAVYYGNEENPGSAEVRDKDTVTKTPIKTAAKKAKSSIDSSIEAMNKNKKKPSPTIKTKGVKAGDKSTYTPKKKAPVKKKGNGTELFINDEVYRGKPIPPPKKGPVKKKKPVVKYKTTVVKGKVIRKAVAASKASEGLYQKELAEARLKDKSDITDDYAARGVLHSGLYAQKQGDYEKEYGKQVAETNRQKASKYADLAEENRDFMTDQELQKEQARLEAVRRRAARTGKVV